mmetsp:Transcript_25144/g.29103  ORF Transcript_25144/g.29103 Transcript_25144/m.29103 type:complete len:216 (-) Transcript_25144:318-965(-)
MTDNKENETSKQDSPHKLYFDKLSAFIKEHAMLGQMLIKGLPRSRDEDDESEDDDESNEDITKHTQEEMDSLRFILINNNRSDMLDLMREFVLGDQAHENFMMFNTSFSYGIYDGFYEFKKLRDRKKNWNEKFDLLFAYTYMLQEFDVWMYDNEGGMNDMVSGLARLWKSTLKKTDEELGIDAEYTRPGILEFLSRFKENIEEAEAEPSFKFNYC